MRLRLSPEAQADLQAIHDYLIDRSPQGCLRVLTSFEACFAQLEDFPLLGHPGRIDETRELKVSRYPYVIVYDLPDAVHIDVLRILHSAQMWPND